jgi:hypothetical protein
MMTLSEDNFPAEMTGLQQCNLRQLPSAAQRLSSTKRIQWTRRLRLCFISCIFGGAPLMRGVSCDMKLHSVLLGWTRVLTKSCVSPQVLHGSMRLTGGGPVAATVRGMKPSRQCSKPASLKAGER